MTPIDNWLYLSEATINRLLKAGVELTIDPSRAVHRSATDLSLCSAPAWVIGVICADDIFTHQKIPLIMRLAADPLAVAMIESHPETIERLLAEMPS